jgi:hypothetical protein
MNSFSDIGLEFIQSDGQLLEPATLQITPQKIVGGAEKSGDLGDQFKSRNREIRRCGNISLNFSILIGAACDGHNFLFIGCCNDITVQIMGVY